MSMKANKTLIGGFVVGAVALAVIAVVVFGSGFDLGAGLVGCAHAADPCDLKVVHAQAANLLDGCERAGTGRCLRCADGSKSNRVNGICHESHPVFV